MENIKILLVTKDFEYAEAMCSCVRHSNYNINLSFAESLDEAGKYDMYIIDGYKETKFNGVCVYLTEQRTSEKDNCIYKYSKLSHIVMRSIEIYQKSTGMCVNTVDGSGSCKVYLIFAAKGGVGCSSIAMGIANDFAIAAGEEVLYVSTGILAQELQFFSAAYDRNIREYLYKTIYDDENNIDLYLSKNENGVYAFNTATTENEIYKLTHKEFTKFLNTILKSGRFDKVIIDGGNYSGQLQSYLISVADNKIFVQTEKSGNFESMFVNKTNCEDMIKVVNFGYKGNPKFDEFFENENKINGDVGIAYDKDSFDINDGIYEIAINGEFGKGIREIISYIANFTNKNMLK